MYKNINNGLRARYPTSLNVNPQPNLRWASSIISRKSRPQLLRKAILDILEQMTTRIRQSANHVYRAGVPPVHWNRVIGTTDRSRSSSARTREKFLGLNWACRQLTCEQPSLYLIGDLIIQHIILFSGLYRERQRT